MNIADYSFLTGAALFVSLSALANSRIEPREGWSSWQIEVPAGTPTWCCFVGDDWRSKNRQCNLDSRSVSFTDFGEGTKARVYVRVENGVLRDARVYDDACPVKSRAAIADLGVRGSDESLRSVAKLDIDHHRLYPALAAHGNDAAAAELKSRAGRGRGDARDEAWFWIARLARPSAETMLFAALEGDAGDDEQLVFALSQLPAARGTNALLRVLKQPSQPIETRKRALFWLGQSDDPRAQQEIAAILD